MMTQLDLFGYDRFGSTTPDPGQPLRVRDKYAVARMSGKELLRFDARPHDQKWYIKQYSPQTGGWKALETFTEKTPALDRYYELLGSGNYAEG